VRRVVISAGRRRPAPGRPTEERCRRP
jgi:hypothetical protein